MPMDDDEKMEDNDDENDEETVRSILFRAPCNSLKIDIPIL